MRAFVRGCVKLYVSMYTAEGRKDIWYPALSFSTYSPKARALLEPGSQQVLVICLYPLQCCVFVQLFKWALAI